MPKSKIGEVQSASDLCPKFEQIDRRNRPADLDTSNLVKFDSIKQTDDIEMEKLSNPTRAVFFESHG